MSTPKSIIEQVLKLKPVDRYLVIDGLLRILDEPDKTIDEIWAIEAEKDCRLIKKGR